MIRNSFFFLYSLFCIFFFTKLGSSSYHPNTNRRSARYPDREKDRLDRLERERERIHARERDMIGYNLNDDELINDRHYGSGGERGMGRSAMNVGASDSGGGSGSEYPMHRDERRVIDRDLRDRDLRETRMDARDRREHYVGSNSRHLMNNSYDNDNVDLIREKEKERYAHRRDEYSYSPHRGNRRVLNMNAM